MKGKVILNLESKPRILANVTYLLSKSRINIEDINYVDTGDRIIVDLSVDNPKKTMLLLKQNGFDPKLPGKNILIALKDHPGTLFKISKMLDSEGVKLIRVTYLNKGPNIAVLSVEVDKKRKAEKVLRQYLI
ncbi:hypothetical protein KO465_03345 [Candidatus Micrarchaeota archaeon]|jgi:hypothetical protein|nr:hypothetical protein [Candidatus Micrarchaeota archaeon]